MFAGLYRHRARYLADVLGAASGRDCDLLQSDSAGVAALQYHVAWAEFAVLQARAREQALQGSIRFQRTLDAWRGHTFCQFGRQSDLPTRHCGERIKRRYQWLLVDCKTVVAHARGTGLSGFGGQCRQAAGAAGKHGQGQQGEGATLQAGCA
ncbi:hypothetical protein D3C77_549290 [compost metagenome]